MNLCFIAHVCVSCNIQIKLELSDRVGRVLGEDAEQGSVRPQVSFLPVCDGLPVGWPCSSNQRSRARTLRWGSRRGAGAQRTELAA